MARDKDPARPYRRFRKWTLTHKIHPLWRPEQVVLGSASDARCRFSPTCPSQAVVARLHMAMHLIVKKPSPDASILLRSSLAFVRWKYDHAKRAWHTPHHRVTVDDMERVVASHCRDPYCRLSVRGVDVDFVFPEYRNPLG